MDDGTAYSSLEKAMNALLMICVLLLTGFGSNAQSVVIGAMPGTKTQHGSQFEIFVSNLKTIPENQRNTLVKQFILSNPNTPVYETDSIVSLYWYGKAKHVYINGDLQFAWSALDTMDFVPCGDSAFFHRTYTIPPDARLDYQFRIDSTYTTDPRNPAITPSGYGPHSEIAMPGFTPDAVRLARPGIPRGTITNIMFTSRDTSIRPRAVKIYVPAGYENLSQLSALYVVDGFEAMDYMSYPVVLDNLIADGKIAPVIAIFIPPVDRAGEFMGPPYKAFMNAICDELVPLIDRQFKTSPTPAKRGITGISAGGYFAMQTILQRNDVFYCGAGQSPTLPKDFQQSFRKFLKSKGKRPPLRFYFDVGQYDLIMGTDDKMTFLKAAGSLHRDMQKAGMEHAFNVYNDGHEWANWRERTDDILIYFWGKD